MSAFHEEEIDDAELSQNDRQRLSSYDAIGAVSYTHLDVYKRQSRYCNYNINNKLISIFLLK